MSAAVNDRDAYLGNGQVRKVVSSSSNLFVTPSANAFYSHNDGSHAPDVITVKVTPVMVDGPFTFSAQGCTLSNITATTADIAYSAVSGAIAVVTVQAANGGAPVQNSCTIGVTKDGASGSTTWTWVKYADTATGGGLSDDPTGKIYIGLAYNKSTATESVVPTDYAWSLIKGTDGVGVKGDKGDTTYTWVKYSNSADGSNPYDVPNDATMYIGLAVNKLTATESTIPADYTWSKFRGADGVSVKGDPGTRGAGHYYTSGSAWSATTAAAACPGGAPIVGDVVTISNGSTYTMEEKWDGSAWVPTGGVIDGSLIVTGSVTASKIDARGLSIKDSNGNVILAAGSPLPAAYAAPGTLNSDLAASISSAATTATWTGVGGRPDDPLNLLTKSTFDDGLVTGWGGTATAVAAVAVTGQPFLKAAQFSDRDNYEATQIPVVGGETLYVSAWLDASTAGYDLAFGCAFFDANGSYLNNGANAWNGVLKHAKGATWAFKSASLIVPAGTKYAKAYFQIGGVQSATDKGTARATSLRISRFQSGATVGAPAGTLVGGVDASTLVTNASTALANAKTANDAITAISSDNVLSKGEKSDVIRQWNAADAEHIPLANQADSLGVNRDAYWTAFTNLANYLPAGWNDTTVDTAIVGTVFRDTWNAYYTAKQALLNAMAAKASTMASWGGVSGTPANVAALTGTESINNTQAIFTPFQSWEFRSTIDGWTVGNMYAATLNPDSVTLTASANDPNIYTPVLAINGRMYDKIRMRVRRMAGSGWQGQVYYGTSGSSAHSYVEGATKILSTDPTVGGAWTIVEWDMAALSAGGTDWVTSNITGLRIDLGQYTGDAFEIDWVAIGKYGPAPSQSAILNTAVGINSNGTLVGAGVGQVTLPGMGQNTYRVISRGNSQTATLPATQGFYANGVYQFDFGRSYTLVTINRTTGAISTPVTYDVFGVGAVGGKTAANLAADLNALGPSVIAVVASGDEPSAHRMDSGLDTAMYRCGASRAVFGSSQFQSRAAYVLIGIPGCGEGNGAEAYQGAINNDPNAWVDVSFNLLNGALSGVSNAYTPRTLTDYGYVGDLNATVGATWGVNIGGSNLPASGATVGATWGVNIGGSNLPASGATVGATIGTNLGGQFTAGNASTYIASAAIQSAMVADLRTTNYAEDASLNATSGAKLASAGTALKVANNSLRVGSAVFTDYWARLVYAIDGSADYPLVWRGNNDSTVRSGTPNIACLQIQSNFSFIADGVQTIGHRYKVQPTTYNTYDDNLDNLTSLYIQWFGSTTDNAPFADQYITIPPRQYNKLQGFTVLDGVFSFRFSGAGAIRSQTYTTSSGVYSGYQRVALGNLYGYSQAKDFGPGTGYGSVIAAATITGGGGSSAPPPDPPVGGGTSGGQCPAPWVPVRLMNGTEVYAGDLHNGARVAAVDDTTMLPLKDGGVVRDLATIWAQRYRVRLTDGSTSEWSENHRMAVDKRGWVSVQLIRAGDHILGLKECIVESVIAVGKGQVISFRVEGAGTYFAGGLLCHNRKMLP